MPNTIDREVISHPETAPSANTTRKSKSRWWIWLLLLIIGAAIGYRQLQETKAKPATTANPGRRGPAAQPVVTEAKQGDIPIFLSGLGSVTAFNTVTIRSRVDGQLVKVSFQEGQLVHEGDLLAQIDPRPFQVMLEQAEGQMAKDQAQLKDAQVNLDRSRALFEAKVIARQQYDTQTAAVAAIEGSIKSDQAQIDNAKLQLTYSRITSPLTGRIGLRLVDQGNMVHASDPQGLLVITQLQPIAVLFTIPEDNLPQVLKKLAAGVKLEVDAYDRDGSDKLATGTLLTVDNTIDSTTGTSRLKAVFPNSDNALFPNQFVNARLLLETKRNQVIVPAPAIQRGPSSNFVYVVKNKEVDGKQKQMVEVRPVKVGVTEGNNVSLDEGVEAGEIVVIDGADKLQDKAEVELRKPGEKGEGGKGGRGGGKGGKSGGPPK